MTRRAPQLARLRRRARRRRNEFSSGLASLEWLLIIAAVGGFAAVMVVAVQQLLDEATEISADRSVRLLEARVLAAELSGEAAAAGGNSGLDPNGALFAELRERCERLASDYPNAIGSAEWTQVPVADLAPDPTTETTAVEHTETTTATTAAPVTTLADQTTTTVVADALATQWTCRLTGRSP